MELTEAAIDQHQAGHRLLLFLQSFISSRDYLAHSGEVVHSIHGPDDELAVVGLLHLAVLPHHHRSDGLGALNVRDVEALDALGQVRKAEGFLQSVLNGARVRLHHPEALIVGLLGIVAREVEQRPLFPTLGD